MLDRETLRKAWTLLDAQEKLNAAKVLAVMVLGALGSAAMVGAVFPFLSVLSDPTLIEKTPVLRRMYAAGDFSTNYDFLVALGMGAITVILLSNLVLIVNTWAVARFSAMRIHSISRRLLAHYLAQPYAFFLGHHSGDMSTNILMESQQVVQQFLRPLAELISGCLTVAAVVAILLVADPWTAVITIGTFVTIYIGVIVVTRRYVRKMGQRRAQANATRFRLTGEALGGIKDVKLFGREAAYLDRYSKPSTEMAVADVGVSVIAQAPRYAIQIVAFGGIIILCLALLETDDLIEREALSFLPIVGLLAFAGQRLMPELQKIFNALTQMTAGSAAVDRVYNDLRINQAVKLDRSRPEPLGLRRALELKQVSYTYPAADRPGLSDVNLSIRSGERIGIVGGSGAGKTTLADVILGLLPPSAGSLTADGQTISCATLRAWQQSIGYVPQDIFLSAGSLAENIAFGISPEEIDSAKVESATRIAQLHDFVMNTLPDGYATQVGERGIRLSGGQRQRIGIARALYNDADLIVLDEATSALDNPTEREVMSAIEALPGDKTLVMIAHRLTTLKVCDRIVVMERGRVAGVGTWAELISTNSAFRALAEAG